MGSGFSARQWTDFEPEPPSPHLMFHAFSGDPWGRCTRCDHPAYHPIHRDPEQEAEVLARISGGEEPPA